MRLAMLLIITLLVTSGAAAQTALLDTPLFQLNDDGGLVSLGSFGTGTIPATGPGARLMWHPKKAAFRAGLVQSTKWDEANVGDYSVAMGINTTASGEVSTAMGNLTTASGLNATALGAVTEASGEASTAMGFQTTASGLNTTAMGDRTEAGGEAATALGRLAEASGEASTAMGLGTTASSQASTAMGQLTTANGTIATAMGFGTTASGFYSVATGYNTTASGVLSTTLGQFSTAQAYASLVLGRYNVIAGNPDSWVSSDPVLVVGNGSDDANPSNALVLLKNGNLTIAGTLTQNSDRRLKQDIHPLTNAAANLGRLQPVRYRFREGTNRPEGEHLGLIAQEVEAVFPELVSEGALPGGVLHESGGGPRAGAQRATDRD